MVSLPIAVVDTGAGGLSVVQAIRRLLPNEDIHYYADTANLPYGIKSPELIQRLAIKMATRVKDISSCKIFVVACHTISVRCIKDIEQVLGIPVIGMVEPTLKGLELFVANKPLRSLGILSTKATYDSGAYRNAWSSIDKEARVRLVEQATGMLVSLVEEGEMTEEEQVFILDHILSTSIKQCDALLIGCTHFSALISPLLRVVKPDCEIIDAANFTGEAVLHALRDSIGCSSRQSFGQLTVHVSDNQDRFANIARRFMPEEVPINLINDGVV